MNTTPAITAFAAAVGNELIFGQVLVRRRGDGFELRHGADKNAADKTLRPVAMEELRRLAQFAGDGIFRPLKSAPNLGPGWRMDVRDEAGLGEALERLYPGAVADWFAARSEQPPVTSYRQFVRRQTGMYRLTDKLDDAQAGAMIRACCHIDCCLKHRHWTVEGLAPDGPDRKSIIPCLEPCAILLEFARKMARVTQEEAGEIPPRAVDPATAAEPPGEMDFDHPRNPRRLRFDLEKQSVAVKPKTPL